MLSRCYGFSEDKIACLSRVRTGYSPKNPTPPTPFRHRRPQILPETPVVYHRNDAQPLLPDAFRLRLSAHGPR